MTGAYIALSYFDLIIVSTLLLLAGGLSIWMKLGVERALGIAALRSVVQLVLIGFVLKILFSMTSPLWTGIAALVMIVLAGREVIARQQTKLIGWMELCYCNIKPDDGGDAGNRGCTFRCYSARAVV